MQLEFKKVVLIDFGRKTAGGTAKFTASLTANVAKAMGWGETIEQDGKSSFQFDFPSWLKSGPPTGKLLASQIDLEPKSGIAIGKATMIETTLIDSFEIVRTEAKGKSAKKTKATKTELTFKVHFSDNNGCKKLEQYMLTANVDSSMVVVYEKEPEQPELEGMATLPDAESKQGELEDLVKETARKRKEVQ